VGATHARTMQCARSDSTAGHNLHQQRAHPACCGHATACMPVAAGLHSIGCALQACCRAGPAEEGWVGLVFSPPARQRQSFARTPQAGVQARLPAHVPDCSTSAALPRLLLVCVCVYVCMCARVLACVRMRLCMHVRLRGCMCVCGAPCCVVAPCHSHSAPVLLQPITATGNPQPRQPRRWR